MPDSVNRVPPSIQSMPPQGEVQQRGSISADLAKVAGLVTLVAMVAISGCLMLHGHPGSSQFITEGVVGGAALAALIGVAIYSVKSGTKSVPQVKRDQVNSKESFLDANIASGPLQQQGFRHLLAEVIGEVTLTEKGRCERELSVDELESGLRTGGFYGYKQAETRNAIDEHLCKAFDQLKKLEKTDDSITLKKGFLEALDQAQKSDEYKNNVNAYTDKIQPLSLKIKTIEKNLAHNLNPQQEGNLLKEKAKLEVQIREIIEGNGVFASIALLQKMAAAMFVRAQFHAYAEQAVKHAIVAGKSDYNQNLMHVNLAQVLDNDCRAIENVSDTLRGVQTNNFSSMLWDTTYEVGDQRVKTRAVRLDSLTNEPGAQGAYITSAMRLFLDHCKANGNKLLSFQLQDMKRLGEKDSLNTMLDLQHDYPEVFILVALPMDRELFHQSGEQGNAIAFKDAFKQQVTSDETRERSSLLATPSDHNKAIREIIDGVHEKHFGGQVALTREEQQVFQMLSYIYIEQYFIYNFEPDFYHSQSEGGMGRAMSLMASGYYLDAIQRGEEKKAAVLENFRTLVHFEPLMLAEIKMHRQRLELVKLVADHLQGLSDDKKRGLREDPVVKLQGKGMRSVKSTIPRSMYQQFGKLPSGVTTKEEYNRLVGEEDASDRRFVQEGGVFERASYYKGLGEQFLKDVDRTSFTINGMLPKIDKQPFFQDLRRAQVPEEQLESLWEKMQEAQTTSEMCASYTKIDALETYSEQIKGACKKALERSIDCDVRERDRDLCKGLFSQTTSKDITSLLQHRYKNEKLDTHILNPSKKAVDIETDGSSLVLKKCETHQFFDGESAQPVDVTMIFDFDKDVQEISWNKPPRLV